MVLVESRMKHLFLFGMFNSLYLLNLSCIHLISHKGEQDYVFLRNFNYLIKVSKLTFQTRVISTSKFMFYWCAL